MSTVAQRRSVVGADQTVFESVYRDRQTALHHMSYLRMSKVLALLELFRTEEVTLAGRSVLDYSFGAGTLLRHCPESARIYGVEIDPETVAQVVKMLRDRGHRHVELHALDVARWPEEPLLGQVYDVVVCSHVLEHVPEPLALLRALRRCTAVDGCLAGLVPINERHVSPHHVQRISAERIGDWAAMSDFEVTLIQESDPWSSCFQKLLTYDTGVNHRLAQMLNLLIGVPATVLGHRRWAELSVRYRALTGAEPAQLGFLLRPC